MHNACAAWSNVKCRSFSRYCRLGKVAILFLICSLNTSSVISQVKRCDEMARKLRFFTEQVCRLLVLIAHYTVGKGVEL